MKAIIDIVFILLASAYLGGLKITFSPFSIALPNWKVLVSVIFFVLALGLWGYFQYEQGLKQGKKVTIEAFEQLVTETNNTDK